MWSEFIKKLFGRIFKKLLLLKLKTVRTFIDTYYLIRIYLMYIISTENYDTK